MDEVKTVAWIRQGADGTVARGPECPDEQDLAAFVDGRLAAEDGARLTAHLADCDHCLQSVAFLGRVGDDEPAAAPEALVVAAREGRFTRPAASSRRAIRQKAAAPIFAAVTTVVLWTGPATSPGEESRVRTLSPATSISGPVTGAPRLVSPLPGEPLAAPGGEIRWTPIPMAVSYQVRIVDLDGDVVWEERVFEAVTELPSGLVLLPGEPYLVRVGALLPGGKTLDSEHVRFFVRSP